MKFLIVVAVLAFAAAVSASVIPNVGHIAQEIVAPIATSALVQGPSTKTHVVGPDGSQIIADAPGGTIVANEQVAVPIVAAAPVLADAVVEVVAAAAPVVEARAIEAPVITNAVVEPLAVAPVIAKTIIASPLAADGYPLLAPGSGVEGQYVPDNTEKLFDDGSYKGEGEEEH